MWWRVEQLWRAGKKKKKLTFWMALSFGTKKHSNIWLGGSLSTPLGSSITALDHFQRHVAMLAASNLTWPKKRGSLSLQIIRRWLSADAEHHSSINRKGTGARVKCLVQFPYYTFISSLFQSTARMGCFSWQKVTLKKCNQSRKSVISTWSDFCSFPIQDLNEVSLLMTISKAIDAKWV